MPDPNLFRAEVVARRAAAAGIAQGSVLRLTPRWVDATYRVVVAAGLTAALFAVFGRVGEVASGPAVIQFEDRRAVTAVVPGAVAEIAVEPGDTVSAGDPLVVLHDGLDQGERDRTEQQYQVALVEFLRDPVDDGRRAEVARWRGERLAAKARADAKVVRAPVDGVVSEVYAQRGQALAPGDLVASLRRDQAPPVVVALLPGRARPLVHPGMPLRMALPGFEGAAREAVIVSVGAEVVGPAQAVRTLGIEAADAVSVEGPAVVVRAQLADDAFDDGGRALPYVHGMTGEATVRVRSEPVIVALVPGLRRWWGGG